MVKVISMTMYILFFGLASALAEDITPEEGLADWLSQTLVQPESQTDNIQDFVDVFNTLDTDCAMTVDDNYLTIKTVHQFAIDASETIKVDNISVHSSSGTDGPSNTFYSIKAYSDDSSQFNMTVVLYFGNTRRLTTGSRPIRISMMNDSAGQMLGGLLPDPFGAFGFDCSRASYN